MKTGLVLEGGAMRGMFTAGVIDVFMENNIDFQGAIGVSAGVTFGCNIKSRQIGRGRRIVMNYSHDYRYGSLRSLLKSGDLFEAKYCYYDIPNELDPFDTDTFEKNPMEFYVVATDILSGGAVYHKLTTGKDEDIEWIRASASMPLVSKVVKAGGFSLLDGGIADSIPIKYFNSIGYDRCVIVLTQPYDYEKEPNELVGICKKKYYKYPKLVEAIAGRHVVYNETTEYIKKLEKEGRVLVIRPPKSLGIDHTEKDKEELERVYRTGREEATEHLEEVRSFLGL